jgi:hypothetical protein
MAQQQLLILLLKIVIVADVVTVVAFAAIYTALAKWWKDPIGRTIMTESVLLALLLLPSLLSFFVNFNRLTSEVSAWADVGLFALLAVAMAWRSYVWVKIHRAGKRPGAQAGPTEEA